jgi:hypothetical protein
MMGLPPSELEHITPYQFNLMREGYAKDQKSQWERARHISYWGYVMAGKMVDDPATIEEFLPLSKEDLKAPKLADLKIRKQTPEEEERVFKYFNPDKEWPLRLEQQT